MRIALGTLLAALLLAGCGGGGGSSSGSTAELAPPVGTGADRAWVLRPDGTPKSVVVFVHGLGGPGEILPTNHLPWLRHLVAQGNAVIYPAYEVQPGGTKAVAHILAGVRNGMHELGDPKVPLAGIGYSRGGRLVVEWAALQRPAPKARPERVPVPDQPADGAADQPPEARSPHAARAARRRQRSGGRERWRGRDARPAAQLRLSAAEHPRRRRALDSGSRGRSLRAARRRTPTRGGCSGSRATTSSTWRAAGERRS